MEAYETELSIVANLNQRENPIESVMRLRALVELSMNLSTESLMELASATSSGHEKFTASPSAEAR